ncbi:MAG: DUF4430 domain-containing protein [Oscillospiraceae bacterium]|nr:DUF4430 domain-containing protein [Oscillospiraceae bacterium]
MKSKRLLSLLLALTMILSAASVAIAYEAYTEAPSAITIEYDAENVLPDGKIVCHRGDGFTLRAYDQDGEETPVVWKNASSGNTFVLDEDTGEVRAEGDIYSGGTSYLYFTATSLLDETVSAKITVQVTGFLFSGYQKEQTVALSADGQTAKTASVSGGLSGYNRWSYSFADGMAELSADPGTGGSIRFNVFRPGTITATFALDFNDELTDTATVTVTGVAVEDEDGNRAKTYLSVSEEEPEPTRQLVAFAAEGRTIAAWESGDEAIAEVSETGLVTAKGVGSTIITATDDEGVTGGIKVVVESADIPYFECLEFSANAFESGAWTAGKTFAPTRLEYDLPIRVYSTSSLTLQAATLYDTDKYTAVAEYTDINGEDQSVTVNSGKITTLKDQPFDDSVLTITLADKSDPENRTVYIFNVHRPRDTAKALKSGGIVLVPAGRALSVPSYQGVTEGTMQKADEYGELTSGTGVSGTQYFYRTFIYDDAEGFKLTLSASTAYAHIRYSTDGAEIWTELPQGGGDTATIEVPESASAQIVVQIIDDLTYTENERAGKDGFADAEPSEYKVWVDKVVLSAPSMLTAEATGGDWYPAFSSDKYSYWLVAGSQADAPVLTYTVEDGNTVKIGSNEQEPDENGIYSLELKTSQTSITVSNDEGFSNTYKFGCRKRSSLDVPDRVIDYLCIGSQYTNGNFGTSPEATLSGSLASLGNFGGYITYYYEDPITDDPKNKYGMDFYVIGNSQEGSIDSMAEPGQVYISEDGEVWYALAGSEHYEDNAIWDYTITYTKGSDGKGYWADNYGNSIDYAAKAWPSASVYYMNDVANTDSYTFTGVLLKSQLGSITGDGSTGSYASKTSFGYADYYATNISGTTLTDVNSYVENPSKANGFDVLWAVDEDGIPIDVSEKEFHYVRVATASNIYAGAFMEKSTEVAYVARTTPQDEEVGKTDAPTGVTISDGTGSITVDFNEDQTVYPVNLGEMKNVSVTVNGTADDDNIYVNNQRVASGTAAEDFEVAREKETLVRVIVQNGDKEPALYLLKLTGGNEEPSGITVRFTLLGDENHNSDTDGIDHTLKYGNLLVWIAETEINVPENSTVMDVLAKALTEAGYSWVSDQGENSAAGNYITSITTPEGLKLGAFTNGELSGWLYTLNGNYPDLGVGQQPVKDGDIIVLHYTDNYMAEYDSTEYSYPYEVTDMTFGDSEVADITVKKNAEVSEAAKIYISFVDQETGLLLGVWVGDLTADEIAVGIAEKINVGYRLSEASGGVIISVFIWNDQMTPLAAKATF